MLLDVHDLDQCFSTGGERPTGGPWKTFNGLQFSHYAMFYNKTFKKIIKQYYI